MSTEYYLYYSRMNTYIFIHGRCIELQMFVTGLEESVHACDTTGCKIDSWQCRVNIMSHVHNLQLLNDFKVYIE